MSALEDVAMVKDDPHLLSEKPNESRVGDLNLSEKRVDNTVTFDTPRDPTDPLNWSLTYKWLIVALVSMSSTIK